MTDIDTHANDAPAVEVDDGAVASNPDDVDVSEDEREDGPYPGPPERKLKQVRSRVILPLSRSSSHIYSRMP